MQISPTSLSGSGLPSSATIMTSVDGTGSPIEPSNSLPILQQIATGEVSVRPYPCRIVWPVFCFHSAATAGCTAMPPPILTRMWLKSILSKLGVCISDANIVLTPVNRLNSNRDISFAKASKSRGLVISTFSPPWAMTVRQFPSSEKM